MAGGISWHFGAEVGLILGLRLADERRRYKV